MPGKTGVSSFCRNRTERFSRSSSLTRRTRKRSSENGLRRSSPSVRGRLMPEPPNTFLDYTRKSGHQASVIGFRRNLLMRAANVFETCRKPQASGRAEARGPSAEAGRSADVAVASGFPAGVSGAVQAGKERLEVFGQHRDPLALGTQRQQLLLEVEVERE